MASFPGQRAGAPPKGPTTPSSLSSSMVGLNVQLTWLPSSEGDVPVSYIIYRCSGVSCSAFSQLIVTPTGASSYTDSSISSFTAYSYRIAATDAGGNTSGFSNITSIVTPDTTTPSVPTLSFTNNNNAVQLSWNTSTDPDDAVAQYNVLRSVNNGPFATLATVLTPTTSFVDSTIQSGSLYQYFVTAQDSNGNISNPSNTISVGTSDSTPPSVPTGLTATPVSSSRINLSWNASTDSGTGVKNYTVFRNSVAVTTVTLTTFADTGLSNFTVYTYTVLATDNANNSSAQTGPVTAQTLDQIAPTTPGSFTANPVGSSEIDLSWTASTDQGSGVSFYTITRNPGAFSTQASSLSYKDLGLSPSTVYSYTISATDNSGNASSTASTSATTGASQTSSFAPNFPRIAFNAIGTTTDDYYNNVTVTVQRLGSLPILSAYGKYNIFVLGADFEGWNNSNSRDRQVLVNNLKAASTANLGTKVLMYGDGNQYAVTGTAYPTWLAGVTSHTNWTLYNNSTASPLVATPAPDANGAQNVINIVNYAENSAGNPFGGRNAQGESPYQWTAHYQFYSHLNKTRTGTDASRFTGVSAFNAAPALDGIQFDNMWVDPRVNGDYQVNGTQSTKDNGAYEGIWSDQLAKGQRDYCDTLANLISAAGQTQWLCGNAGDYGHTELGNTLTTAGVMNGVLNSSYFESGVGKFYSMDTQQSFAVMLADYFQMYDFLKDPHAVIMNMCVPNGTSAQSGNLPFSTTLTAVNGEYQWARYMIASTLLGDGYTSLQRQTSGYNGNGADLTWYDELDNAGAGTGYLGQAVDARQSSIRTWYDGTTIPNVYAREYQNGIAIVVAKTGIGAAAQPSGTVTISGAALGLNAGRSWTRINGTQAPAVNNGSAITSAGVTLQASRDGIVLLKNNTGPTNPLTLPLTNNAGSFFTYLGRFNIPSAFQFGGAGISAQNGVMYVSGIQQSNNSLGSLQLPTKAQIQAGGSSATTIKAPIVVPGAIGQAASNSFSVAVGSTQYLGSLYIGLGIFYGSGGPQTGWLVQANPGLTTFGTPQGITPSVPGTLLSNFTGNIGYVPSLWQPILGGPLFVSGGIGLGIVNTQCCGFGLSTFDPAFVKTTSNSVPVNQWLNYPYGGSSDGPGNAFDTTSLWNRPNVTGSISGSVLTVTAVNINGTVINAGATIQWAGGQTTINSRGTGTGGTGTYNLAGSFTAGSQGIWISNTAVSPVTGAATGGNDLAAEYDGSLGTPIWIPGTRTIAFLNVRHYGPTFTSQSNSACDIGASGSRDPRRLQLTLYDLATIVANKNASNPLSAVLPYQFETFPNAVSLYGNCPGVLPEGCFNGMFAVDPSTNIMYGSALGMGGSTWFMDAWQIGSGAPTAPTYSTSFPNIQNPLSEGGYWANSSNGTSFTRMRVGAAGQCYGTNIGNNFDDSYAHMIGYELYPNQFVQFTVGRKSNIPNDGLSREIEVHLHMNNDTTAGVSTYEVDFQYNTTGVPVVRWNGASGNFTVASNSLVLNTLLADGDVIKVQIVNGVISGTQNGVSIGSVNTTTDNNIKGTVYASGNPGIGAFIRPGASNSDLYFKSVTIGTL